MIQNNSYFASSLLQINILDKVTFHKANNYRRLKYTIHSRNVNNIGVAGFLNF